MATTQEGDSAVAGALLSDETGFQRDLLYAVALLDRPCGLEIKQYLSPHYSGEIHQGRLYPNLDTLVEKGLIQKGEVDQRTNWYGLTERGERELRAHLTVEDQVREAVEDE